MPDNLERKFVRDFFYLFIFLTSQVYRISVRGLSKPKMLLYLSVPCP